MEVINNTSNASSDSSGKGTAGVSVGLLRAHALQRLAGVHERLEGKGVSSAFLKVAKADPVGDMGFMNSLIFHAILAGPLADLMDEVLPGGLTEGLSAGFNHLAGCSVTEGISALSDIKDHRDPTRRTTGFYPKGRRKCSLEEKKKMKGKFNFAAANQNGRFSHDVHGELAHMFEIMDMLEHIERQGVSEVRIDEQQPVHAVLKAIAHTAERTLGVRKKHKRQIAV